MGRGAEQECSGCRETPGGSVGRGNGKMDGGGRDKGRRREKYKASLRRGQSIRLSLYRLRLTVLMDCGLQFSSISVCLYCRPHYTNTPKVEVKFTNCGAPAPT